MSNILSGLNEKQYEAVVTTEGPVMVMAGAGSGKTRVLTHRIAYITNELGISPTEILAVTFTNKAAREMKERLEKMIDDDIDRMWVSTFHSICCRILRVEIGYLDGYDSKFTIIDEEDSLKIIKDIIKDLGFDSNEIKPKTAKNYISAYKNDMMSEFDDYHYENVYKKYQEELNAENLLDFDDLILKTLEVFEKFPKVLEKYQNKFQYILVDEFQDTNTSQYKLVKLLAYRHKNIFVVGDQDQSIYSFRGAKIGNIGLLQKDFLGTKVILLEENYRSTQNILNIANNVINNNHNRFKKNLFTNANSGHKPVYYCAESAYGEALFVVEKIKELLKEGYDYKDFAILYRSNALSRGFEDIFIRFQIPYVIYGGLSFFARKEVKDILAYIKLIINHDDDFALKRIINEPKRKIGPALIKKLSEEALEKGVSMFKAIDTIERGGQGYTNLLEFKFKIIELEEDLLNVEAPLYSVVESILSKTGYEAMLKAEGEEGRDRLNNVKELMNVISEADEFYEGSRIEKLESMLSEIALRTDNDNKVEGDSKVKLMSYHQAKGLEYKVVFLVAFEEGIFPSALCFKAEELEEERRICYVGITRAMEHLYISSAAVRSLYGKTNSQYPSRYLREIGLDNLTVIKPKSSLNTYERAPATKPIKEVKAPVFERKESTSIKVGDKINHKAFGDGTVAAVNGDIITVAFAEPYGVKKLIANHPSIVRL